MEKQGTFLEAGAYDGEFLSNTLFLEKEYGWRGILVEANPDFFKRLLKKNRKSYAVNICLNTNPYPTKEEFMIASSESDINHVGGALHKANANTVVHLEQQTNLASSRLHRFKDKETPKATKLVSVQCVPIYTVVQALGLSHIDFLSLDVEHAEMGILDTIPWDKLSFTVLAIESTAPDELIAFMTKQGYAHIASEEGDHIFVNDRKTRKV
ncbi:unnamed protein product [Meganyctiphanes norvegica]|uniref:Methyltransferase FkbM domain-containing protein n=1 Tax=Meganyctiphanes norvegica TaxID=48144 RepID=A0AAV2S265_MEGNR